MTIDDHSSIYVGGLSYEVTEEGLRRVFYEFGDVIAVKKAVTDFQIINDRAIGGKCYGFVTFANPRSATQAIKEMDGKTISGRVVRVNGVRTRGGRPNFNREAPDASRHHFDRSINGDRGRHRGRDDSYDRNYHHEGHRERSEDHDHIRDRAHGRSRGHDRRRDHYVDEERLQDHSRHVDDIEQEHGGKRERDWERDNEKNIEQQRNAIYHESEDTVNQQQVHPLKRSRFDDYRSREISLESLDNDQDQGEHNLAVSTQKLEELREEVSQVKKIVADKQEDVTRLQEKYQKLEDSLNAAKKFTSRRRIQLAKLHKCYLQMKDNDERFKKSEQELQWLINSTATELGNDGGGADDGIVTDGRA